MSQTPHSIRSRSRLFQLISRILYAFISDGKKYIYYLIFKDFLWEGIKKVHIWLHCIVLYCPEVWLTLLFGRHYFEVVITFWLTLLFG